MNMFLNTVSISASILDLHGFNEQVGIVA